MNHKEDYLKMYLEACKRVETVTATSKNKVGRPRKYADSQDSIIRDKLTKEIGQRVREFRKIKQYTQQELANKASVTMRHIYRIEKLKACPDAYVLFKISKALGVCVDVLLGLTTHSEIDSLKAENKTLRDALEITLKIAKEI